MRYYLLMLAALMVMPSIGFAQAEADPYKMPELVVTATDGFTDVERKDAANTIVIDEADIANSGAMDLAELLMDYGFYVNTGANAYEQTFTYIRGYSNGHQEMANNGSVQFFINGRNAGTGNARLLTLNNIERVEIIRGPEMYRYTSSSGAGVINIVTKRSSENMFSGSIEGGIGSYKNYKTQMGVNGQVESFDYALSYLWNKIDKNYKDGNGQEVMFTKGGKTQAFSGSLGYTFLDTHRIGVEYYMFEVRGAMRPQRWNEDESKYDSPTGTDRDVYALAFTYDGETMDKRFYWNASYQQGHETYRNEEVAKNPLVHDQGQTLKNRQFRGSFGYRGDLFDLAAGMDYSIYTGYMGVGRKVRGANYNYPFGYPYHKTNTSKYLGLWTIGTLKLLDNKLNITAGLRYDYDKMEDDFRGTEPWSKTGPDGNPNPNWNNAWQKWYDAYGAPKNKRTFDYLNPSIGVTYLPLDWFKVRASYFRGFRAPSSRQLFNDDHLDGYGMPGIPWNEPEKSDNYEAGFDINWRKINFGFTYYYGEQRNYMWMTNQGLVVPGGTHGREKRIFSGIEINASADIAHLMGYESFEIRPFVNFNYMNKMDELYGTKISGNGNWTTITGMPDMTANYGVRFRQFDWGTSVNLNFMYYGKTTGSWRPSSTVPYSKIHYGKFTIANLHLTQHLFDIGNVGGVDFKFQLNNIFHKKYHYTVAPTDVNWQGRNFYAGLVFNF